ncbi:MAG: alpha/beta hydrolase [Aliishimia sp.]
MSLMRPILNLWLRLTEKTHLARVQDANSLRRAFEMKAKLFFHAPFGTKCADSAMANIPVRSLNVGSTQGPLILYFHGGGYVFGSPRTHDAMIATLCKKASARAVLPDYRKAPENPHPAAIEDAEAAYLALLAEGEDPAQIVIGGDSAGGGLTLALVAVLVSKGHPLPAGAFAFSPLTDMTFSGVSVRDNAKTEVVLPASRILDMAQVFVGDGARDDPTASPLFAEFTGGPPIWLTVGDTEILLSDTERLAERLKGQGVKVDLKVEHDLPHVWQLFHNLLPEAHRSLDDVALWIKQRTGAHSGS